jgi:hypothetical protein
MSEIGILFSGPMVRAILEDRKTQTRRVMKPQPPESTTWDQESGLFVIDGSCLGIMRSCPYGAPGDTLWVRETFALESCCSVDWYEPPFKDGRPLKVTDDPDDGRFWEQPHYRATDPTPELAYEDDERGEPTCKWRPSIFMPRWASRITLTLTDVRVQRVQDISEADAIAEGMTIGLAVWEYHELWDDLNAKRGYSWDANPWVWALSFRRER